MKTSLFLIFCISTITWLSVAYAASQPDASLMLSVSPENPSRGDTITVTVSVKNIEELFAYEVSLNFDKNEVEFVSQDKGGFLNGLFISGIPEEGRIKQIAGTLTAPGKGQSGSGDLLVVVFKTKTGSNIDFSLSDISLIDSSLDTITEYGVSNYEQAAPQTGGTTTQPPLTQTGGGDQSGIVLLIIVVIIVFIILFLMKNPCCKSKKPKKAAKKR